MSKKVALVLEGGGLRGAYTAGCISWLIEHNIKVDSAYGISTGAWHMCIYLHNDLNLGKELALNYINDKSNMGLKALLKGEGIFSFSNLLKQLTEKTIFNLESIRNTDVNAKIGLYNLNEGKTLYYPVKDVKMDHLVAACSLPLLSKIVDINGTKFLDGGITEMIPIDEAIRDNNDSFIVITTKPLDFVRKPSNKFVVWLMKVVYRKYKSIGRDYEVRDKNYYEQIDTIKRLEKEGKAIYRYPSKHSDVTRLDGTHEQLEDLFNLGYQDMEDSKERIFSLCK